ncbi:hypothetical protein [Streptomyces sp. NPDC046862]
MKVEVDAPTRVACGQRERLRDGVPESATVCTAVALDLVTS